MNSRLDLLVFSDYYLIYVTTAPPDFKRAAISPFCFYDYETLKTITIKRQTNHICLKTDV